MIHRFSQITHRTNSLSNEEMNLAIVKSVSVHLKGTSICMYRKLNTGFGETFDLSGVLA